MRRPTSSETRNPVWIAMSSSAWSRRPSQVVRSGAASSALISSRVEVGDERAFVAFGRDLDHARDRRGVLGMPSAAYR